MSRILAIDDEMNLRKLIGDNLIARGYQVLVADDGKNGLKLAKLECPDLILLDLRLRMPGMSGWDVLTALKTSEILNEIPVIIMTAAMPDDEDIIIRSMRAASILLKPFGVDELLRQVENVLGKRGQVGHCLNNPQRQST